MGYISYMGEEVINRSKRESMSPVACSVDCLWSLLDFSSAYFVHNVSFLWAAWFRARSFTLRREFQILRRCKKLRLVLASV